MEASSSSWPPARAPNSSATRRAGGSIRIIRLCSRAAARRPHLLRFSLTVKQRGRVFLLRSSMRSLAPEVPCSAPPSSGAISRCCAAESNAFPPFLAHRPRAESGGAASPVLLSLRGRRRIGLRLLAARTSFGPGVVRGPDAGTRRATERAADYPLGHGCRTAGRGAPALDAATVCVVETQLGRGACNPATV